MSVAVEIDDARLEILEHGVGVEPHGLALAVARLDHQTAGLDLVAEDAVVVAGGRLGEPGARDLAGAGGDAAVGQGVFRQFRLRGPIDKVELGLLAAKYDAVPETAGIDADLALDGLDGDHAGRRIDALRPAIRRLAKR